MKCSRCQGRLIVLETYCTDPYQTSTEIKEVYFEDNEIRNLSLLLTHVQRNMSETIVAQEWYRDIRQRCVCNECGLEQDVTVDTVKQDRRFK